jgi:predicted membrane protein
MAREVRSQKPYNIVAAIIFIMGIGSFSYMGTLNWLPPLTIVVGLAIVIRQMLMGYHFDALVAAILFGACFLSSFLMLFARIFLPTFLILGAIYFIIRQFFNVREKLEIKAHDVHIEKAEHKIEREKIDKS